MESSNERRVLDSWAALAMLFDEPAAGHVEDLLRRAEAGGLRLPMSIVNAGEIFYGLSRRRGPGAAEAYWAELTGSNSPIELVPASTARVEQAARLKAAHAISYADAFAVALARELGAPLATGDPEIRHLADQGVLAVDWLGG